MNSSCLNCRLGDREKGPLTCYFSNDARLRTKPLQENRLEKPLPARRCTQNQPLPDRLQKRHCFGGWYDLLLCRGISSQLQEYGCTLSLLVCIGGKRTPIVDRHEKVLVVRSKVRSSKAVLFSSVAFLDTFDSTHTHSMPSSHDPAARPHT